MLPVVWTVVTSFRPEPALQRNLASLIPYPFTTENWEFILTSSRLWKWFGNSVFVSTTHTLAQLTVCSLAAYAFARLDFHFKRPLYILVLIGLMVPFEATFLPVYLLFSNLRLHNTLIALVLPGIASSFAVFLMTQFFRGIPLELEEAAMMDGAGLFHRRKDAGRSAGRRADAPGRLRHLRAVVSFCCGRGGSLNHSPYHRFTFRLKGRSSGSPPLCC